MPASDWKNRVDCGDWEAIARGLDVCDPKVRHGTMLALEMVYEPEAAGALARFALAPARLGLERARALTLLAQGHRKTPPWDGKWWGTQPTRQAPPQSFANRNVPPMADVQPTGAGNGAGRCSKARAIPTSFSRSISSRLSSRP